MYKRMLREKRYPYETVTHEFEGDGNWRKCRICGMEQRSMPVYEWETLNDGIQEAHHE